MTSQVQSTRETRHPIVASPRLFPYRIGLGVDGWRPAACARPGAAPGGRPHRARAAL